MRGGITNLKKMICSFHDEKKIISLYKRHGNDMSVLGGQRHCRRSYNLAVALHLAGHVNLIFTKCEASSALRRT